MVDLATAHQHASKNQAEIEASSTCGCFFCMEVFAPDEITAWTGWDPESLDGEDPPEGLTAICPKCGSESVIGDKSGFGITAQFLGQMHQAWFQKTMLYKPGGKR